MISYKLITLDVYTALFDTKNSLKKHALQIISTIDASIKISEFLSELIKKKG